jgi:broad specificity phosphatase PhoE
VVLLFARHGNTFEAHETPRIVGAHEDLALTQQGEDQAKAAGDAIKAAGIVLKTIVSGPLIRTRRFAEIVADRVGFTDPVRIDERLRELDFGAWSGLSDEEVAERFGQEALDDWRKHGRPHALAHWAPGENEIRSNLRALAADLASGEPALCVTSNGVLRYAMELDPSVFAAQGKDGGFRVKTGRLCAFRREGGQLRLISWDLAPEDALAHLRS